MEAGLITAIAKEFDIPKQTISDWNRKGLLDDSKNTLAVAKSIIRILRDKEIEKQAKLDSQDALYLQKVRLITGQAEEQELKNLKQTGELVAVSEIVNTLANLFSGFKARSLAMPIKAASMIRGIDDQKEIEIILKMLVEELLTDLANFDTASLFDGDSEESLID